MQIKSLAEFTEAVKQIVDKWTPPNPADWYVQPWFRGHGNMSWSLEPSWYRSASSVGGIGEEYYKEEAILMEMFKLRSPTYLERLPATDWEWLFLMQHYGLRTRLLDWTESSLIALYFALRDNPDGVDAAVWVMSPWWLNRQTFGVDELFSADDPRVREYAPLRPKQELSGKLPLAIIPNHASPRIAAQRGKFTIHGSERGALDRLAGLPEKDRCLQRLVIPSAYKDTVYRDVTLSGIGESVVFPELSGLCREIARDFFGE